MMSSMRQESSTPHEQFRYDDYEEIRRYEDWIEDSLLERNRRLRRFKQESEIGANAQATFSLHWIVFNLTRIFKSGQGWFIISLAGINAAIISIITAWLSDIKMGYCRDAWWLNRQFCCWEIDLEEGNCTSWRSWGFYTPEKWIIYVIFAAIFSLLSASLVKIFARYAAGSGISEIKCIIAGFVMKGYLGGWTLFIKSLTLPLIIASGLSVGKEGPSVHVACCIGNIVARLFSTYSRNQEKMREILLAASAAGVAVAFGSPIGGVLFSIEGLYGALVVKLNLQVTAFRRRHLSNHGVAEAVILATITALVGYFNKFLRIDMTESLSILFRECDNRGDYDGLCQSAYQWRMANSLLLATAFRIVFVILSYGCKVPAGIFVPSMAIGATFGRMVGIIVKAVYRTYPQSGWFAVCQPDVPCITPGTYAFLGAAAALGGVMRLTVCVVVIMFELTGALTYILPTMIVLLVTKAVGDFFGGAGIADELIRFNGYPLLEKSDNSFNISVSQVMTTELYTLKATGMSIGSVERLLQQTSVKGFPVVSSDGQNILEGYLGRSEIEYVLKKMRRNRDLTPETICSFSIETAQRRNENLPGTGTALGIDDEGDDFIQSATSDAGINMWLWVNQTPLTVSPRLPLEMVVQLFKRMGPRVILVESRGVLVGLITVKDVLKFIAMERGSALYWDAQQNSGEIYKEVSAWFSGFVDRSRCRIRDLISSNRTIS
ncbi:hypothetical protein Clacol_000495 [Clathrus columnatus]|uniref:Chloride channel protein n=1 Tax=Clathrus columnatus TaxID=1419009 RepID=A0AAV4ZZ73_9AGAM|nr:hypothetical protein Clacol_000495 [Clathrus columnatus]